MDYVGNYLLDKRYTTAEFPLGAKAKEGDRIFKFAKYSGGDGANNAPVGGCSLHLEKGYIGGVVTCDLDSTTIDVLVNKSGGFPQAALQPDEYGWSQVWGLNRKAMILSGTVAVDDKLMPNTAVVGGVTKLAGAIEPVAVVRVAGATIPIDGAFIQLET